MEPLKIIKQVAENLNNIRSQKYGYPPEEIGQKTINNENKRYERADISKDKKIESN